MQTTKINQIDNYLISLMKSARDKKSPIIVLRNYTFKLCGVSIKLREGDTLKDIVRKINVQQFKTNVKAKIVKNELVLEQTFKLNDKNYGLILMGDLPVKTKVINRFFK